MSWVLAVAMQVATAVTAAPAEAKGVTFDEALGLARKAPAVTSVERAAAVSAEVGGRVSSMSSNPLVLVQPGARFLPLGNAGIEGTIGVSQSWSLSGLGQARKDAVKAERDALTAEARAAALMQRLHTAREWLDLWAAQKVSAVAGQEADVARDLTKLAEKARAAEAATKADAADARAYLAEAKLAVIDAEGDVFERGIELARDIAAQSPEPVGAAGDLPEPALPDASTWPSALRQVDRLPMVEARELLARAEKARSAEEGARFGSYLTLGVEVRRESPDAFLAFGTVGLTLPVFDHGERERSVTEARAARAQGEKATAALDARTEMALAFHEVAHTGEIVSAVKGELLPALVEAADAREQLFRAGDGTMVDVLTARRRVLAAKSRLVRAQAANAWAKVKVWLLLAELASAEKRSAERKEEP
jgi:cobalt-zinc-cadmium efflux system outer membrane protein